MARKRGGGCLTYVLAYLIVLGAIISWADFLFKPLTTTPLLASGGLAAVVGDLLQPVPSIYGWPGAGYVFFASTLLIAFVAIILFMRPVRSVLNYLETSEAPVSVLESKIQLYFEDAGLNRCKVTREQRMHANRPNVEAYHYSAMLFRGEFEHNIEVSSRIDNDAITQAPITRFTGKSIEVIERYKAPLPTSRWVTYLPDRMVLWLADTFGRFQKVLVSRRLEAHQIGEYDGDSPLFQITPIRYPVTAITITLNFPRATAPDNDDVVAYLITSNAAQSVSVVPNTDYPGRKIFTTTLRSLKFQHSFRVQWKNTRLQKMRAEKPELFRPPA